MRILRTCICGNKFETTDYRIKDGRGKFCSKKCQYSYATRPSGLSYKIKVKNRGWFKKGEVREKFTGEPYFDENIGYYKIRHNGKNYKYHRYLMEKELGRELLDDEVVHHKDNNKLNNNINNLELFESKSEHLKFHWTTTRRLT